MIKKKEAQNSVMLILALGVVGISFSAVLIRSTTAPPTIIAFYRMAMTTLLFIPPVLLKSREEIKKLELSELFYCCLSGLFLALHFITWITSLSYTTVAASTVIVSLQPIFTGMIGYILFKEALKKRAILGMLIAVLGSALLGILGLRLGDTGLWGNLLALLGAFFGALYIIIGRGMRKKISLLVYGLLVYGSCSLILLLVNITMKVPLRGYPTKDYLLFAAMAVICTIGGHTVFNWGLKYIEANKISTFMLGEPIGAALWAGLLLKEFPDGGQILGSMIILIGLYFFLRADVPVVDQKIVEG